MNMNYESKQIDQKFFTMKGFFVFFAPVGVPYTKIEEQAKKAGYEVEWAKFPGIIEKAAPLGFGWIGVPVSDSATGDNIKTVKGNYKSYLHLGSYKKMWPAYQSIMKDFPKAKQYLNSYLNSPQKHKEEDLKTEILILQD